jgi:hypothetical protein
MELLSPMELMAREEGREEAMRSAILEALETRFGSVPSQAKTRVEILTSESSLRHALRLALTAPSLNAFLENI